MTQPLSADCLKAQRAWALYNGHQTTRDEAITAVPCPHACGARVDGFGEVVEGECPVAPVEFLVPNLRKVFGQP